VTGPDGTDFKFIMQFKGSGGLTAPATPVRPDLQFDLCLVGGLGPHDVLGLCMGFSFEASGVLGSGLPGRLFGGKTQGCLCSLAN
jgi:hypothetical protein